MLPPELAALLVDSLPAAPFLVALTLALAQLLKQNSPLSGKQMTAAGVAIGVILGLGYHISFTALTNPAEWFAAGVFGLLIGLGAVGLFKVGAELAERAGPPQVNV